MNITFDEATKEYLQFIKLKKKKNTYITLENRFLKHIYVYFKNRNLNDITCIDYLNWQKKMEDLNFKYNYKSALHYAFVDFFNFCNKFYDVENIAKKVGDFKNNEINCSGNIWTIEEFTRFINCVDDPIYHLFFTMLFFTGLRKGELLALQWDDIDFNNKTININKTITRTHEFQTPKTKSSTRIIKIDDSTINELKKIVKNNDLVFNSITFSTLLRKKNFYCDKAGVKRIKIHEFRHSHACLLFQNNVPINEISRRLGHSKISITTDTYLKYLPNTEKRVIKTLNSLHTF